ncbi:MAG: hypothetical protein DRI61_11295, partial [Chloroflexi bacterium]
MLFGRKCFCLTAVFLVLACALALGTMPEPRRDMGAAQSSNQIIAGPMSAVPLQITWDNETPETVLVLDEPGVGNDPLYITSLVGFDLIATDTGSGVDCIWYSLDSGGWMTHAPGDINITIPWEGAHTFYYNATDNDGNHEPSN